MISNYLKVALRNFLRHRLYALINVCGLAAGIACCLLIALFVRHELSYDRHYSKAERIYRVSRVLQPPSGDPIFLSSNSGPAAALLLEDFPEVEQVARLNTATNLVLSRGDDVGHVSQLRFVDAAFFDLFDLQWMRGGPAGTMSGPADIVLTESLAQRYFGDADPLGATLTLENRLPVRVTGVIADLPDNTHLSATGFVSIAALDALYGDAGQGYVDSWFRINSHTYVLLKPGAGAEGIEQGLAAFAERHVPAGGFVSAMRIMPLTGIHWAEGMSGALKPGGSYSTIAIFSAIGICILVVACINFINLSTARSSQRALEIGVRKSIGASRLQLVRQFLGESLGLTLLAMLLALAVVELFLPLVSALVRQDIAYNYFASPLAILVLLASVLAMSLVAGAYPALSLSAFSASKALKGELKYGERGILLRNALVVLQFVVSIVLLICTVSIFSQMRLVSTLDLGFRKDQVVVLTLPEENFAQWTPFREQLLAHPEILAVSSSNSTPLQVGQIGGVRAQGAANMQTLSENAVDLAFFETYDIPLLAGRWFSADIAGDRGGEGRGSLILNEAAVREFGWSAEAALGQVLEHDGTAKPVIGVVGNTIESAHEDSNPILYELPGTELAGEEVSLRLSGNQLDVTLEYIDAVWAEFLPGEPIVREFLDSMVAAQYQTERQHLELSFYFASLSIGIACMGLFGLATFNAQRRVKEIGVRKVMGSSVWSIVWLLTSNFSRLVLVSNVIAWPVAYFAMERWLENFAYRIDLTPLVFIGSGLIALCIAWVTVGGTAAKAANAKPVLALRYE